MREDNGTVEVCIEAEGDLQTSVVATLTSVDGTATGTVNGIIVIFLHFKLLALLLCSK